MTGNEIRKQYNEDKNLLAAIDNTLTMLEQADERTLKTIQKAIGWYVSFREWDTGSIAIGALVETVRTITKVEDRERIMKCVYKGKHEGMYKIYTLRSGLKNRGKVVSHK